MRRTANSLSELVLNELGPNSLNGDLFVFLNLRWACIKLLRLEAGGFVFFGKNLKKGTFTRPASTGVLA